MIRFLLLIGVLMLAGCYPAAKLESPKASSLDGLPVGTVSVNINTGKSEVLQADGTWAPSDGKVNGVKPDLNLLRESLRKDAERRASADCAGRTQRLTAVYGTEGVSGAVELEFPTPTDNEVIAALEAKHKEAANVASNLAKAVHEARNKEAEITSAYIDAIKRCNAINEEIVKFKSEAANQRSTPIDQESERIRDANLSQNWRE
jgi:hypothetical protein